MSLDAELLHKAVAQLHGSSVHHDLRQRAVEDLLTQGFPTTRDEHWKYSDCSPLLASLGARLYHDSHPVDDVEMARLVDVESYTLHFVDGVWDKERSDLPAGITVTSYTETTDLFAPDEESVLSQGFTSLNGALASGGVMVDVAEGLSLDRPLAMMHSSSGKVAHVRHQVRVGQASEVVLIEHFSGEGAHSGLTNVVTALHLSEGARVAHYRLQQEGLLQAHIGRLAVKQQRDSHYCSHLLTLGAAWSRVDVVISLADIGANCQLNGLYLLSGRQHGDHHIQIDHLAPHCQSDTHYRGVLDGRARAVFNGKVVVHKGAVKSHSTQSNANLLLSANAEVDTKPELEIYNDDVKCAHGSTTGRLDQQQLFYLQSRGLSESEARQLLTLAFVGEVMTRMNEPALRAYVQKGCFAKLPHPLDMNMEGFL
ncbi:MAG: Fe-S cluster assembly protein SufD [Zetaproteobacteria bacterium]|nr:Fe-S cluster assembly protein SufD [Zetaproteobacteria bacterium]